MARREEQQQHPPAAAARHSSLAQQLADKFSYTQLDPMGDTKYSRVDPMNRFQQLHRQFVRQQQARGPLVSHDPMQKLPSTIRAASASSIRPRDANAVRPTAPKLQAASATALAEEETHIRSRIHDAEGSWRRMIDLRVFEVKKARAAMDARQRAVQSSMGRTLQNAVTGTIALEDEQRAQLTAAAMSLLAALTTSATVETARHRVASRGATAALTDELQSLSPLERLQRTAIEDGEASWRHQASSVFRAKRAALLHARSLRTSDVTSRDALQRVIDGEVTQREQLVLAERMRRQVVRGFLDAHNLARRTTALIASGRVTQGAEQLRRKLVEQEVFDRSALEGAEHGWWRTLVDAHIRDSHRASFSQAQLLASRVVTTQQLAEFATRERAMREDLIASEERFRIILLHWAIVQVTEQQQRQQTSPHRTRTPPVPTAARVSEPSATAANAMHTAATRAARAPPRDFQSEQWIMLRDEEAIRLQIVEREVQWRQFNASTFRKKGVEVAVEVHHRDEAAQKKLQIDVLEQTRLSEEETKDRRLLATQEDAKFTYIRHLAEAREGPLVTSAAFAAKAEALAQDERQRRLQVEYAQDRWRSFIVMRHVPTKPKTVAAAAAAEAPIRLDQLLH